MGGVPIISATAGRMHIALYTSANYYVHNNYYCCGVVGSGWASCCPFSERRSAHTGTNEPQGEHHLDPALQMCLHSVKQYITYIPESKGLHATPIPV